MSLRRHPICPAPRPQGGVRWARVSTVPALMCLLLWTSAASAQGIGGVVEGIDAGVVAAFHERHVENLGGGSAAAFGGWLGFRMERVTIELDVSRTRKIRRLASVCAASICGSTRALVELQYDVALTIGAIWRFHPADSPISPHLLFGAASVRSYTHTSRGQDRSPSIHGGVLLGVGFDVPATSRIFARVQYRITVFGNGGTQQIRAGAGLRF